jgi:competence protein ComEA
MTTKSVAVAVAATALIATVGAFLVLFLYDGRDQPEIVIEDGLARTEIMVSVDGAVIDPGAYRLKGDARLADAIEAAGGFAPSADFSGVNLAERLEDEQQIIIPALVNGSASPVADSPSDADENQIHAVNINTADIAKLDQLPGIGPVLAQRIVDYRESNGAFTRVEELARVNGISPAMVEELGDQITVGS